MHTGETWVPADAYEVGYGLVRPFSMKRLGETTDVRRKTTDLRFEF